MLVAMKNETIKPRCIVIDPIDEYLVDGISGLGITVDFKPHIPKHELLKTIKNYEILVGRNRMAVDKDLIASGEKLKIVVRAGTGVENIDAEELKKKDILLINAPGSAVESVAELAICLMLMAARDVYNDVSSLKNGTFKKEIGTELEGKTLGILGFGRIGGRIAELAKAFNMRVLAGDLVDLSEKAGKMGVKFVDFEHLFSESDIISINLSMEGNSKPLLGTEAFKLMKEGVIIVNTARAAAVDLEELKKGINSGKVGFYATDVLWTEPPKGETELQLIQSKKFISTSHIGAQTREAQRRVAEATLHSLTEALGKIRNKN